MLIPMWKIDKQVRKLLQYYNLKRIYPLMYSLMFTDNLQNTISQNNIAKHTISVLVTQRHSTNNGGYPMKTIKNHLSLSAPNKRDGKHQTISASKSAILFNLYTIRGNKIHRKLKNNQRNFNKTVTERIAVGIL